MEIGERPSCDVGMMHWAFVSSISVEALRVGKKWSRMRIDALTPATRVKGKSVVRKREIK